MLIRGKAMETLLPYDGKTLITIVFNGLGRGHAHTLRVRLEPISA